MISDELIYDEDFNRLSLEAQNLFVRMLSKADDCGIVPANDYTLTVLANPPQNVRKNIQKYVSEIVAAGMGVTFEHAGKVFFAFKRESFDRIQSYVLKNRTKSEYLNLGMDEALLLISRKFSEVLGNVSESGTHPIERYKQKAESRKKKDTPENVEEVRAYFTELGDAPEADVWWDHFSANGFVVGKAKTAMKDWKATCRTWMRNKKKWNSVPASTAPPIPRKVLN